MANLTRKVFTGWNPSQERNGDPSQLLRMDNLQVDESGVLKLIRGSRTVGPNYSNYVSDLFSKTLNGVEQLYVSVGLGESITRSDINNIGTGTPILSGGGSRACFGSSLGQVYACSGSQRKKDNGTLILDLGIRTPNEAPLVSRDEQGTADFANSWDLEEGDKKEGDRIYVDKQTLRGSEKSSEGLNALVINGKASADPASDRFYILAQFGDSSNFTSFRVEIFVGDDSNYYSKDWDVNDASFTLGINQQTQLGCLRSEFVRNGSDSGKDWTSVSKIRVTAIGTGYDWFIGNEARFKGGGGGQLNGLYEYCSINVLDNGIYQAKSGKSPNSQPILVFNGTCNVSPLGFDTAAQQNEIWVFRRSLPSGEFRENLDGTLSGDILVPGLDQFYFVGKTTIFGTFFDNVSDTEALQTNITLNEALQSVKDITETFIGMEGLIAERQLYVTSSFIYLSDTLNPDAVDLRFTQKAFGDPAEINLWIRRVSNSLLVLGTTKDLYEISGTFNEQPDGSIDITIRNIGEKYPPICQDTTFHSVDGIGSVFYSAADGIRVTTGSNSALVSVALNKLYQGEKRYGIPPMAIYTGNTARYSIAAGRNKLYCQTQHTDGTRRLFIYDLVRKYWRVAYTDPVFVFVSETDRVFLGFGLSAENTFNIREVDYGTDATVTIPGHDDEGLGFNLETVLDDNGQPRNRKDTFTWKLVLDTGGEDVAVFFAKDKIDESTEGSQDWQPLGYASSNGQGTIYFTMDFESRKLGFRYALRITNRHITGLKKFILYEYDLEYEPRPEQLNYLRLQNTNLGTISRKQFTSFPLVVDTLGHDVVFTPFIDNIGTPTSNINHPVKLTHVHYFDGPEYIGTDIGGTLKSVNEDEVFEFYGVLEEGSISEKLPPPTTYLKIPATDYGTPDRKRFTSFKFVIHTRGAAVTFTPKIDGVEYTPQNFITIEKRTVEYFFSISEDVKGIDIGGALKSLGTTPFEYYGTIKPEDVEVLPPRLHSFFIPTTNYGTPDRKRHTSYKFQIDTYGANVLFTPIVDGVAYTAATVNTSGRRIFEYFFDTSLDVKGIDISGSLQSESDSPFEFYKVIEPQSIEKLPPRLCSLFTPSTNFGVASKKRVRTIPMEIDTGGRPVLFTPVVDGVDQTPTTFNTNRKSTVFHYFSTDVFGVDYAGKFQSTTPFEFYGFGKPESVEVLPVGKTYDEIQVLRFDKIAKIFEFRVRVILLNSPSATPIPWSLYSDQQQFIDGVPTISGTIPVVYGKDQVYTVPLPKSVNGTIFRLIFGPCASPFYRYDVQIRASLSGMESDSRWRTVA